MYLTFQMMTSEKYLTNNFEIWFWEYPHFGPSKCGMSNMTIPALPMTLHFYCKILFYSKHVDVCKNLELNPLRLDRNIRVLSSKKKFSKCFICSPCERKTPYISGVLGFCLSIITHLFYMWFNFDTMGHKKAPGGKYQGPKLRVPKG